MRILVVKLSSLGDLLHALPTVHALRVHFDAQVDWAVQSEYAELVACFEDVRRVIEVPRHGPLGMLPGLWSRLREERYDLVIDLQGLLKSAVIARSARGARCLGPSYRREGAGLFYDAVPGAPRRDRHALSQAMDVLDMLGIPRPEKPVFPIRTICPEIGDWPRPWIGLAPMSRWPSKNWPVASFASLGRSLQIEQGATLIVLGTANDGLVAKDIAASAIRPVIEHCGTLNLPQLSGMLSQIDVLVSNDSGPAHLAAALGTPCVVMYGPTQPGRTGPWGQRHEVLIGAGDCTGCRRQDCRFGLPSRCLAAITPERVAAAVTRAMH